MTLDLSHIYGYTYNDALMYRSFVGGKMTLRQDAANGDISKQLSTIFHCRRSSTLSLSLSSQCLPHRPNGSIHWRCNLVTYLDSSLSSDASRTPMVREDRSILVSFLATFSFWFSCFHFLSFQLFVRRLRLDSRILRYFAFFLNTK